MGACKPTKLLLQQASNILTILMSTALLANILQIRLLELLLYLCIIFFHMVMLSAADWQLNSVLRNL